MKVLIRSGALCRRFLQLPAFLLEGTGSSVAVLLLAVSDSVLNSSFLRAWPAFSFVRVRSPLLGEFCGAVLRACWEVLGRGGPVLCWDARLPSSRPLPLAASFLGTSPSQLVCLRSCACLASVASTGSRAPFRAGPFEYRVLTVCGAPALSLGLSGRNSALSTLCPFSAALKCPSLPLSPQSLCGVGLVFSRRPLEACRILPPGTAPGVGHVWFPCVFADFMVVCILSVFYRGPVFKVFADFVTVLLPLCVLAFWLPDLRAPSSTAKGRTSAACAGRPSLSRWAAREGPLCLFCLFTFEGE